MVIETNRFRLRKLSIDDADEMYPLAKDYDVGYNCGWKAHESLEETKQVLMNILINDVTWGIFDKQNEKLMGIIGLNKDRRRTEDNYKELGYWLGKPYWGKGIMVEVARAILHYGFEDLGLQMISISHFPFNERSKRVIEKLGFIYEGCQRETFAHYTNKRFDEVCYSLKKEEFLKNN